MTLLYSSQRTCNSGGPYGSKAAKALKKVTSAERGQQIYNANHWKVKRREPKTRYSDKKNKFSILMSVAYTMPKVLEYRAGHINELRKTSSSASSQLSFSTVVSCNFPAQRTFCPKIDVCHQFATVCWLSFSSDK